MPKPGITTAESLTARNKRGGIDESVLLEGSLGQALKRRRKAAGLELSRIAMGTKIRKDILRSIESDNYGGLSHDVYTLGLVKRYSEYLGLQPSLAAQKYWAERGPVVRSHAGGYRKLRPKSAVVTTRVAVISSISFVFLAVAAYLVWLMLSIVRPPALALGTPADDVVVTSGTLELSGTVSRGATVYVNGAEAFSGELGNFEYELSLQPGYNLIVIEAKSKQGRTTKLERNIVYRP